MLAKKDNISRSMTIDPGDSTGWAYWGKNPREPMDTGQLRLTTLHRKLTLDAQLSILLTQFAELVEAYEPTHVIIEGVQVWGGSLISMTSAVRGNLMKLSYLIGGYCAVCLQQGKVFQIINPNIWKGQLNKDAIKKRVVRANGQTYKTSHITDAVALGLALTGRL